MKKGRKFLWVSEAAKRFLLWGLFFVFCVPLAMGQSSPRKIVIRAISGLQYDSVRIKLVPGETVAIILENTDEMAHNLVVTQPGKRKAVVDLALKLGAEGQAKGFVPQSPLVLAAIPVLNPDEQQRILFTVPNREAVYPFVCTYPGHGAVMYGAFYATENMLPDRATDLNIPEKRRTSTGSTKNEMAHAHGKPASGHPYPSRIPTIYRTFMPNSGPASIAVRLFKEYAYCWDAGSCRFRYFWKGGFLDMQRTWSGKGIERADIVGVVVYREEEGMPFRLGNKVHIPTPDFKGYRLQNRFPTFLYELDGTPVTERIMALPDRPGIKRTFTFMTDQPVWFFAGQPEGISIEADKGSWEGDFLHLSPEEAKEFTLFLVEE